MVLCCSCMRFGYCPHLYSRMVSDEELNNAEFVRDVRATAFVLGLDPADWVEWLTDCYRDYKGRIVDLSGQERYLPMQVLEAPHIREWFRDWACTPCPAVVTPRVRIEAKERIRIVASILRAVFPDIALMWGVRADNENTPLQGMRGEHFGD